MRSLEKRCEPVITVTDLEHAMPKPTINDARPPLAWLSPKPNISASVLALAKPKSEKWPIILIQRQSKLRRCAAT